MHPSLEVHVQYLEIARPQFFDAVQPLPLTFRDRQERSLVLQQWHNPTATEYRELYRSVGARFLWWERLLQTDAELLSVLNAPETSLYTVSTSGGRVGYAEVERRSAPLKANISYLGLVAGFAETGIGGFVMRYILNMLWAESDVYCVTLNTCNLDHPQALGFYRHIGFTLVRKETQTIRDPRTLPELAGVYDGL